MPNYPLYHCPCLPFLPPTLPSAAASLHTLDALYFCDECDAIRCTRCVSVDVAAYFCPGCLFEVPSASVRAERNRCARNCFQCPECPAALHVVASDAPESSTSQTTGQPPYFLECRACGWNSSSIGMAFEKPVGLARKHPSLRAPCSAVDGERRVDQVLDAEKNSSETTETDRLQSHFDHYLHRLAQSLERESFFKPARTKKSSTGKPFGAKPGRAPFRASPGAASIRQTALLGSPLGQPKGVGKAVLPPAISEDPDPYRAKSRWADAARDIHGGGLREGRTDEAVFGSAEMEKVMVTREQGMVRDMQALTGDPEGTGFAGIEKVWDQSWAQSRLTSTQRPTRTPLLAKRTLRCPACAHTLIRPETKPHSTRYKIKVVAMNYLPGLEVGARQCLGPARDGWRDGLKRDQGVREKLEKRLTPGNIYAFQLALTNPLLESISVTLSPGDTFLHGLTPHPEELFEVYFPQKVVPVGAFGESVEDRPREDVGWLERGESVSKVTFHVAVHEALQRYLKPGRDLALQFDLNLEFTYTVEEEYTPEVGKGAAEKKGAEPQLRKVEKTFGFDTRVTVGSVVSEADEVRAT